MKKKMSEKIKAEYVAVRGFKSLLEEAVKTDSTSVEELTKTHKKMKKSFWDSVRKEGSFGSKEPISYNYEKNEAYSMIEESAKHSIESLLMNLKTIMLPIKMGYADEHYAELLPDTIQRLIDYYDKEGVKN